MEISNANYSCDYVRNMDIVDYLEKAGHHPVKIKKNNYWYLSPLRTESTASFKIDRHKNRWYDHGAGKGGNLIDLGTLMHQCSVADFLQIVNATAPFKHLQVPAKDLQTGTGIIILHEQELSSNRLIEYLKQRNIPRRIANKFCCEIHYSFNGKKFYAIGFKNDEGGYELRNEYFKNSSAPKTFTTIQNNASKIAVFEGFFDFLSFNVLFNNQPPCSWNFCILNSIAFFDRARNFLEQHSSIHLYLDNDTAGQKVVSGALKLEARYHDEGKLYEHYKDLNEWTRSMGKASLAEKALRHQGAFYRPR